MKRSSFLLLLLAAAVSAEMDMVFLSVPFNNIIGMDYFEPTDQIVVSLNYASGQPNNFALIAQADGAQTPFTSTAGFTDEVKIATAKSDGTGGGLTMGGFMVGDLFVGNGIAGQIVRITDAGATVLNPWVSLGGVGLMRGSMIIDRTGVWGGDLIVCTTSGFVFRVTSAGVFTQLYSGGGIHMEGINIGPNDPAKFGPLAGAILIGREGAADMVAIQPDLTVTIYPCSADPDSDPSNNNNVPIRIEDIDIVTPNSNWFGAAFSDGKIAAIRSDDWAPFVGEILINVEAVNVNGLLYDNRGLFWLRWNFNTGNIEFEGLNQNPGFSATSVNPNQWEHMTFGHAGIDDIGSGSECASEFTADEACATATAVAAEDFCVTLCFDENQPACSGTIAPPSP